MVATRNRAQVNVANGVAYVVLRSSATSHNNESTSSPTHFQAYYITTGKQSKIDKPGSDGFTTIEIIFWDRDSTRSNQHQGIHGAPSSFTTEVVMPKTWTAKLYLHAILLTLKRGERRILVHTVHSWGRLINTSFTTFNDVHWLFFCFGEPLFNCDVETTLKKVHLKLNSKLDIF